jgi:alpha-L-rhamnosidase
MEGIMINAIDLRVEYRTNPIDIFTAKPRFSWKIKTAKSGFEQGSYSLEVAKDDGFVSPVWKSGKVNSAESHLVEFGGSPLGSASRYFWRVKITDKEGEESPWSKTAFFETTLLSKSEWKASFISGEDGKSGGSSAGHLLRKEFSLQGRVKSARLYASAKGIYVAYVNGKKAGDEVLAPGWTEYKSRLLFQTYDVTSSLVKGANAIGFMVGPGWYKGDLAGWLGKRNVFGKQTAIIAQLRIVYEDGKVETICSDKSWKRGRSPVTYSELYNGETYDARLEQDGWNKGGFNDKKWQSVYIESANTGILKPRDGLPVKEQERFKPLTIFKTPKGDTVIDFGQNISGWVRFKVKGKAGSKVKIRHAETLDADGNFYTANLRRAKQIIEYTLKGKGEETYSPFSTFQGFRYIAIDKWPGKINKDNFEAWVIYSDMRQAGKFKCSYRKLNQFINNVRWSMKDNFVDVPTDCPQRDERLGWTGDAHIFLRSASYLMETAPFFRKWLRDVAVSQLPDGQVPYVVPDVLKGLSEADDKFTQDAGGSAWADVAVGAPWILYTYFGDKRILEEQYPSMKKWVDYIHKVAEGGTLFNTGFQFGDWVALDAKEGSYFGATPNDLCGTAFYAYSADILAKAAALLGKNDDAEKYAKLRKDIEAAYHKEFFTPNGRLAARTQTAHILSLAFGLTPPAYKQRTINALVDLIAGQKNHLDTGFMGTPYACHALADNGRLDLAYELLLKEDFPSWLYQVTKGATTVWEHWDGIKPDGTMWSPDMNSLNHYAYGAVSDFVFCRVGGLDTDHSKTGFKRIILKPMPGPKEISWAETDYESPYGLITIRWEIKAGNMTVAVTVPPNTTAELTLPGAKAGKIGAVDFKAAGNSAVAELGSGSYSFTYKFVAK